MSELAKSVIKLIGAIGIIAVVLGFIFFPTIEQGLGFFYGVAIGVGISIYRFFSIEKSFTKAVEKEANQAKIYARFKYLIRMFVVIVIMVLAAINHPTINIYGLGVGVATLQIAMYLYAKISVKKK